MIDLKPLEVAAVLGISSFFAVILMVSVSFVADVKMWMIVPAIAVTYGMLRLTIFKP